MPDWVPAFIVESVSDMQREWVMISTRRPPSVSECCFWIVKVLRPLGIKQSTIEKTYYAEKRKARKR